MHVAPHSVVVVTVPSSRSCLQRANTHRCRRNRATTHQHRFRHPPICRHRMSRDVRCSTRHRLGSWTDQISQD